MGASVPADKGQLGMTAELMRRKLRNFGPLSDQDKHILSSLIV